MSFCQIQWRAPLNHLQILKIFSPLLCIVLECRFDTTFLAAQLWPAFAAHYVHAGFSADQPDPAYPSVPTRTLELPLCRHFAGSAILSAPRLSVVSFLYQRLLELRFAPPDLSAPTKTTASQLGSKAKASLKT
jgi:hypothetical protein